MALRVILRATFSGRTHSMRQLQYSTRSGIAVTRSVSQLPYQEGMRHLVRQLDRERGVYLSSGYEYPGRYSRWDVAMVAPPFEIVSYGRRVEFRPLNERGALLLEFLEPILQPYPHWESLVREGQMLVGQLRPLPAIFPEEERSK